MLSTKMWSKIRRIWVFVQYEKKKNPFLIPPPKAINFALFSDYRMNHNGGGFYAPNFGSCLLPLD